MGMWVDIPWVVGQTTISMGSTYHGQGGRYTNTMVKGSKYHGYRVDIPRVWGQHTMGRKVDILVPWLGVKIPLVGGQHTVGKGSKYHG